MTTKTVQKVQKIAEDSFIDENFGQLDLRGMSISGADLALIDLRDPFMPDDKFAPIDSQSRGFGSVALKRGIAELAENDAEVQKILHAHGVVNEGAPHKFFLGDGTEATVFLGRDNKWRVTANLESGQQTIKLSSANSRDGAMFGAESYFGKQRGPKIHALSKDEELYVARLAGRGKLEDAVMNYMAYAVPDFHGTDISSDPKYLEVCNQCAWFVFVHSTPQFQDSDEAREFMTRYIGDRPITVQLLQFAFAEYKKTKEKEERGLLMNQIAHRIEPATVTGQDLDDLPDQEIDTLFHDVTRESLRSKIRR